MVRFLLALVLAIVAVASADAHPGGSFRGTPFNPFSGPRFVPAPRFIPQHNFSRGFVPSRGGNFNSARGFGTRTFVDRFGRIVTVDSFGRVIAIQ